MIKSAESASIRSIVLLHLLGVPVTLRGPLCEFRIVVRENTDSGFSRRCNGGREGRLGESHGSGSSEVAFKNLDDVEHHCMRHQVVDPLLVVFTVEAWKLVGRNGERL